jgi:hypothetical protein
MSNVRKVLKQQFAAHEAASVEALAQGATPKEAAIKGLVAELMFRQARGD